MLDLEKIEFMKKCNWKPAVVFWKELYDLEAAKTKILKEELEKASAKVKLYEKLDYKLRTENPDKSGYFFISGASSKYDVNGLPDYVTICPAYGCDWSVKYEKK